MGLPTLQQFKWSLLLHHLAWTRRRHAVDKRGECDEHKRPCCELYSVWTHPSLTAHCAGNGRQNSYWHGTSRACSPPLRKHYYENTTRWWEVKITSYCSTSILTSPHSFLIAFFTFSLPPQSLPPQCPVKALLPSSLPLPTLTPSLSRW